MATRRRTLFGSSLATAAATVLSSTSAQAAPITSTPDVALIKLCDEFRASEAAFCRIYDGPDCPTDDESCDALAAPILRSWADMLDRMEVVTAATPEGLAARAAVLAQHSGIEPGTTNYPFAFDPADRTITSRLLHYLLRDAVALAVQANGQPPALSDRMSQ